MSRHDADLEAFIRSARTERPVNRWEKQRILFRRLGLGGEAALLAVRLSQAAGPLARAPRLTLGVVGLVAATTVAGIVYSATPDAAEGDHRKEALGPIAVAPAPIAVEPPAAPAEPPTPTISVTALPAVPQRVHVPAPAATSTPREEEVDELAKETASLSRIRARLAAREFSSALEGVREHRAAFRRGLLEQEVTVLEVEAHQGLGNDEAACALGRGFLEGHPTSAHRKRVMNLVRSCNP